MKRLVLLMAFCAGCFQGLAQSGLKPIVAKQYILDGMAIAANGKSPDIIVDDNDWEGVKRAAGDLQRDIKMVTGNEAALLTGKRSGAAIIIGTIGKSRLIDGLVADGKINVAGVAGKWESTLIQVVKNPVSGVDSALVIAGSDKRGAIYGIYELSSQIGVSPWYYWADVAPQKSDGLY
ncbi:MAG: glycosyl hydrolase, partial [Sphingobacteriales bacterium]